MGGLRRRGEHSIRARFFPLGPAMTDGGNSRWSFRRAFLVGVGPDPVVPNELGRILPTRQDNLEIVVPAFLLVVEMQTLAQQVGINADNRIRLRIEVRWPP